MCHRASEARAWQCNCGYEFGQNPDQVIVLLRDQRRTTRITLAILLCLETMMIGGVVWGLQNGWVVLPTVPFIAVTIWTVRAAIKLAVTRASLRQLGAKSLPEAKLLKD
jgi:hypothetical protein